MKFLRNTYLWLLAIPLLFIILGTASNQAVLIANNDTFPVQVNPVKLYMWSNGGKDIKIVPKIPVIAPDGEIMMDSTHCVMTDNTNLNFLADVFDFHSQIVSIGDLSLELGEWMWSFAPFIWGFAVVRKLREVSSKPDRFDPDKACQRS